MLKQKHLSRIRDLNIKGSGRFSLFLAKLLLGKPKEALTIHTIYDFKLHIDPVKDKGVEQSLYYFGTYEKGTLDIIDKILTRGDTFVDVGANIGLMSIFASKKVGPQGRVFAFEPNPITNAILARNIALNDIENITVESYALSNEVKKGRIYDRWDINRGGASLIKPEKVSESYDIEETTFTTYFNNIEKIKVVKIDVEGYELNVLKGARDYILSTSHPPALIVEFSSNRANTFGTDTAPLFSYLKDFKIYRFFKAVKGKERLSKLTEVMQVNSLPQHDNIFCLTDEHVRQLPNGVFKTTTHKKH